MREDTHIIFGTGISTVTATLLGCNLTCLTLAALSNIITHPLIDRLGHEKHWWYKHPKRHAITHSLLGATILSLAVAALIAALAVRLAHMDRALLVFPILLGGLSHLFLDMLNPSGIYLCGRRVRIGIARYNSLWANLLFQAIGILLTILGVSKTVS